MLLLQRARRVVGLALVFLASLQTARERWAADSFNAPVQRARRVVGLALISVGSGLSLRSKPPESFLLRYNATTLKARNHGGLGCETYWSFYNCLPQSFWPLLGWPWLSAHQALAR